MKKTLTLIVISGTIGICFGLGIAIFIMNNNVKKEEELTQKIEELEEKINNEQREMEEKVEPVMDGEKIYQESCIGCHGQGIAPSLKGVTCRLSDTDIQDIIINGRGSMPGGLLSNEQMTLKHFVNRFVLS